MSESKSGVEIHIYADEWYPVYGLGREASYAKPVTIPASRKAWIDRVFAEFDEVQEYLKSLVEAHD